MALCTDQVWSAKPVNAAVSPLVRVIPGRSGWAIFEIITRRHHRKSLIPSQGNFCPFSELLLVPKYPEGSRAQQQTLATFKCSCISHGRCHQGLRLRPPGDTPRYHHSGPTLESRAVTSPFLQLSQEPENRGATELHQLRRTQAVCLPSHQGRGKA